MANETKQINDLVPNLSPRNLVSVKIGKDFMLKHASVRDGLRGLCADRYSSDPRMG